MRLALLRSRFSPVVVSGVSYASFFQFSLVFFFFSTSVHVWEQGVAHRQACCCFRGASEGRYRHWPLRTASRPQPRQRTFPWSCFLRRKRGTRVSNGEARKLGNPRAACARSADWCTPQCASQPPSSATRAVHATPTAPSTSSTPQNSKEKCVPSLPFLARPPSPNHAQCPLSCQATTHEPRRQNRVSILQRGSHGVTPFFPALLTAMF